MDTLDIIILIFLACVITYAITYNVNNTLNNKLSNVAINIPPITIPPAQITVKVQKSNEFNDSYNVFVEREKNESNGQIVSLSQIEGFSDIKYNSNSNISSSEELKKINEESLKYLQEVQNIKTPNVEHKNVMNCNKSLLNNKINAYESLIINSRGINNHKYPMCSTNDYENILSDDGSDDHIVNEYKKYQQYVKTYLEDPIIRGSNVNDYDNLSNIENIGKINLSNGEIQPKPLGFVFSTSPAYIK